MPNDGSKGEPRFCLWCGAALIVEERAGRARPLCRAEGCGFVHWGNPTPVIAAVVEHDEGVVLVRAHGWPEKMYGLVTGFLERDETPEEGVLREVQEELGLHGRVVSLVGAYAFPQRHELIVAYHVRASGTVVLGDELVGHRLIPPDKLRPWPFGTGLAVRDWLARRVRLSG
jgi:NAD+ diphosphatase